MRGHARLPTHSRQAKGNSATDGSADDIQKAERAIADAALKIQDGISGDAGGSMDGRADNTAAAGQSVPAIVASVDVPVETFISAPAASLLPRAAGAVAAPIAPRARPSATSVDVMPR